MQIIVFGCGNRMAPFNHQSVSTSMRSVWCMPHGSTKLYIDDNELMGRIEGWHI